MNYLRTVEFLALTLTDDQHKACRYLERAGQRFCIDFGYANAIDKAREHWRAKRRRSRR